MGREYTWRGDRQSQDDPDLLAPSRGTIRSGGVRSHNVTGERSTPRLLKPCVRIVAAASIGRYSAACCFTKGGSVARRNQSAHDTDDVLAWPDEPYRGSYGRTSAFT